ncbi:MAG: radical SAM/SPASM domain-containing protein [Candidatus Nanoarchaeia archaeon]
MVYSEKPLLHERQKNHKEEDLKTIVFDVTNKCNMHCPHCYFEVFRDIKPIALEKLKGPFEEIYDMGVYHFILGGGEPIQDFKRLESIVSMIHPKETYITVLSNGWNMTLDNLKKLRDMGIDKITFSLDSGIEKEHDEYRKKGSYKRVLKAVDEILENEYLKGMFASITAVPTHESLYSEGFNKLVSIAKEKQIRLQVDIAMPVGGWEARTDILLTEEDSKYLKDLSLKNIIASDGHPLIKRDLYNPDCNRCRAGTEGLYITVDGQVTPCNFLQFTLGNIGEKSIRKMREDLLKSEWFNGKQPKCLCGENRDFINNFIVPYKGKEKPLDAYEIFGLNNQ